jgi:hypothetical protein
MFVIESKSRKHRFETLELAKACAAEIFARLGIVVGIEFEPR